ncbi:SoxR reducing system RseC family protein [Dechloromonas sp. XY25]|uniref:SoxR reducing system RseC family protein n=1 Tax=Dechloromonas hankyongensis TaxID=2908002 RepID=A0ABS9K357_9RHOO|nr:SoxR reducing system RseC family protein [Dechloromonas hankyongensis]MCG2577566.1 SoxR reducing system RseC family protein [Dechloromonas hankyongensis]
MNEELITIRGVVRALDGSDALVEVEQGGCGRCHEEGGCGGQQLTQMFCGGPKSYHAENTIGAGVGDRVVVATAPGSVRRTANLAYGIPLLGAIGGAFIGMPLAGDAGAVMGAVAGLVAAFAYIGLRMSRKTGTTENRPYIVSRS